MTADDDLDAAVGAVFRGPLEDFVARRDSLVKELRAAGRTADAKVVKALRKPKRTAWALDAAVHEDQTKVERLATAVAAMVEAQSGRGDVRDATDILRSAARELAVAASRAADEAGHPVDPSVLGPAVLAVIGDPQAFEALRTGRLIDVPAGGALDLLTGAPPVAASMRESETGEEPVDTMATAEAREALERAEAAADRAHAQADAAQQTVDEAESKLETADERLEQAERDARSARTELRRALEEAKEARRQARDAARAAAKARARLDRVS